MNSFQLEQKRVAAMVGLLVSVRRLLQTSEKQENGRDYVPSAHSLYMIEDVQLDLLNESLDKVEAVLADGRKASIEVGVQHAEAQ